MNKKNHPFLKSIRLYLRKDLLNKLKLPKDIPLSLFVEYLIEKEIQRTEYELQKDIQKFIQQNKRQKFKRI
jgi:hypothetical protein